MHFPKKINMSIFIGYVSITNVILILSHHYKYCSSIKAALMETKIFLLQYICILPPFSGAVQHSS